MASFMDEGTEYWHNQGQSDYADGTYDPPALNLMQLAIGDDDFSAAFDEALEAYVEGWSHAKSQS